MSVWRHDAVLKRSWVFERRVHHGLLGVGLAVVGVGLAIAGIALIKDDWADRWWPLER